MDAFVTTNTRPVAQPASDATNIGEFREQSVLAVIGLSIITFGIYMPFWFDRQAKVIDRLLPYNPVSRGLVGSVYVLFILSIVWIIPEILTNEDSGVMLLSSLIDLSGNICALVLIFKIRNRINIILGARPGDPRWFSGVWTFFLTLFYVQGKINKTIRQTPLGFCTNCGYNLYGLPEPRCPECGMPFDPIRHRVTLAMRLDRQGQTL